MEMGPQNPSPKRSSKPIKETPLIQKLHEKEANSNTNQIHMPAQCPYINYENILLIPYPQRGPNF